MTTKKRPLLVTMLVLSICLPLCLIFLWALIARWPFPDLWPSQWSTRGIKELLRQGQSFYQIIGSSVLLSVTVALLSVIAGLMTARLSLQLSRPLQGLINTLASLPFVIPVTVFVMGIHPWLIQLGLAQTYPGLILIQFIFTFPYANYLILDGYHQIGLGLEEQATLLGAARFKAFWLISFPLLLPVMLTAFSMTYIVSFSHYFISLIIGGGTLKTFTTLIFPYLQSQDRTIASIYSLGFLLISLIIFYLFNYLATYFKRHYF